MAEEQYKLHHISLENDPYTFVIRTCFNRWKPYIIRAIDFDGCTRFNILRQEVPFFYK